MGTDLDRITIDPERMNGQACIGDLRLTARRALQLVSDYPERAELFEEYPELEEADLRQALAHAAAAVEDRVLELPHAS